MTNKMSIFPAALFTRYRTIRLDYVRAIVSKAHFDKQPPDGKSLTEFFPPSPGGSLQQSGRRFLEESAVCGIKV